MRRMLTSGNSSGVTIPELIVVVTVLGLLIGMLFGPLNDFYTGNSTGLRTIIQTTDTRAALRTIERDVTLSSKFLTKNNIDDLANDSPVGVSKQFSWTGTPATNASSRVLIVQAYGTTKLASADDAASRDVVIQNGTCNSSVTPITINFVYFVYNGNLYKRTLKTAGTAANTGCNGTVAQKRSCLPTFTGTGSSTCELGDVLIVSNVTYFNIDYYVKASDPSPDATAYNSTASLDAYTSIKVTLTTTTGNSRNLAAVTSKMQITRINGAS